MATKTHNGGSTASVRSGTRGRTARKSAATRPTEKDYDKAFAAWKAGEHIADLAAELGIRRGALRHHLTARAGGRDEFKAMRNEGAGGIRTASGERAKSPALDKNAKVLRPHQTKNWRVRHMRGEDEETVIPVFVDGRKQQYVPAASTQKADVIKLMGNGLPPTRLVRFVRAD